MKIIRYILICLICILTMPMQAQCKSNSAEDHVKDFYNWYIRGATKITIYSDLTEYVDGCVLSALRTMYNRSYFTADYFTKSQDVWVEWLDEMVVHKEMKITDTVSIVPISFELSKDYQLHLIVFVRKEMDGWRIIKVVGTKNFYE